MFGSGNCTGCAVKCYFHKLPPPPKVGTLDSQPLEIVLKIIKYYFFFSLNDHVILNSATISPSAFLPIDLALTILPSPVAVLASIVFNIISPSSQIKVVRPVAFLKYSDSTFTTNIETAGFLLYKWAIAKAPVLISAAIERQAK